METITESSEKGTSEKLRLLTWSLIGTFLGLLPTAYAVLISNSVVLIADLLRCAADFLAILFSWLIIQKISRAELARYNYGFGKFEHLATVAVSGALLVTAIISAIVGVKRFVSPELLENIGFGLLLAILSVGANIFFWVKSYLLDLKAPSPITDSQSRLFRAKTFAASVVAISLGSALLFDHQSWTVYVDPTGSLILAGFMLHSAISMLSSAVPALVDGAVEESIQKIIFTSLEEEDGSYQALNKLRSRRVGNRVLIEIFLEFDGSAPFSDIHATVMRIKTKLLAKLTNAEILVIPSVAQ
jgi:ferrous-iron efflux pump FieF